MPVRYPFYNIFGKNPSTFDIFPLYNTKINGQLFYKLYSIPRGLSFGGIDIYKLEGRDFSGVWDPQTQILTITAIH